MGTSGEFPTASDLDKLSVASDAEITQIWRSIITPHCGCARHADTYSEWSPGNDIYGEAVYGQMSLRHLPIELPRQDFVCEVCQGDLRIVSDPDLPMHSYIACNKCAKMWRKGDHTDCQTGPAESLPEGW